MNYLSNDPEIAGLAQWLEQHYSTRIRQIYRLTHGDKRVYRVVQPGGDDWIVRLYALPGDDGYPPLIGPLVDVLLFLEAHAYPAERIVRTATGSAVASHPDGQAFVTSFLGTSLQPWQPAAAQGASAPSPLGDKRDGATGETFFALGEALGRLHSLPTSAWTTLRRAGMLPAKELAWVSGHLAEASGRVSKPFQAEYEYLMTALQTMNRCEHLPVMLIHNDCNLGNVVKTAAGEIALIDWEVAGLGPGVIDVGILLRNCYSKDERCIDEEAIYAVVEGYCQHRRPSEDELACLPDAIGFMTLVLLAGFLPARMKKEIGESDLLYGATYAAWQTQYEAASEIAAIARSYFNRSATNDANLAN